MSIKRNDSVLFSNEIRIIREKLQENTTFRYDMDWQHNNTIGWSNNTVDANGLTIWNYIIDNEETLVLEFLLRNTILDPNQNNTVYKNGTFTTPLNAAARGGHQRIASLLCEYAKRDKKDNNGKTPLICAIQCETSHLFAMELLRSDKVNVNKKDTDGMTPLHHAVKCSRREIMNSLIQNFNILLNEKNNRGDTPLHIAAATRSSVSRQGAALLLAAGAHIDKRGKYGKTPLHEAIINGNEEIAELLIENKANVNTIMIDIYGDYYTQTPLHSAVLQQQVKTVDLLLRNFADSNKKINIGNMDRTPLDALLYFNEYETDNILFIAQRLLDCNCDISFLTVDRLRHMMDEYQNIFKNHYVRLIKSTPYLKQKLPNEIHTMIIAQIIPMDIYKYLNIQKALESDAANDL